VSIVLGVADWVAASPRPCGGDNPASAAGVIQAPAAWPRRHQRSRKKGAKTPEGVIYCGRPTVRGNPFDWRRFGVARAYKLHRLWGEGRLGALRLEHLGFSPAEIDALMRLRRRLWAELALLRGCDLQCWCSLNSRWCHVNTIIEWANA
jgi:hypothetical protein